MGIFTDFAYKLFSAIGRWIWDILNWVRMFFSNLFQKLFEFLKWLLKPIFILIALIFYFIYKLGYVLILLFRVFLGIGKVLLSIVAGIFKTLAGFVFTPGSTPQEGTWSHVFENLSQYGLGFFQLDTIAYILLFLIWFSTAFIAIRIIANIRGGG